MATQTITAALGGQHWFDQEASNSNAQATAEHNTRLFHAQQRARRGPTPEVFFVKHFDNTRLVKADDPVRKREMRNFAIAMSILFAMAMVYGWQHFSAIEYGYKVEAKKQQLESLKETNRQLSLREAQMCDLDRLDKKAHEMGMGAPRPGQVVRPDLSPDANAGAVMAEAHIPAL
jgi:type VI protein secretion system component VasK